MTRRHLLVVGCGAEPAADIGTLLGIAHQADWSASMTATPGALPFLDPEVIETATGEPPRTSFPTPSTGKTRTVHKADAVIIAPATYNTINKIAAGIADNNALTVVAELIGLAVPAVVVPFVNTAMASRHPYQNALRTLRAEGVRVLGPDDQWEPHRPGTGGERRQQFPWQQAFDVAAGMIGVPKRGNDQRL